ncbi:MULTISPECIES: CBO0543 family protein [Bacillati]|uniref:Uncharacterized protein n=1 Tax=Niallia taxi TaxID=2499688 RepID=A0A437K438_9BACI|nr:CBO0543 family protein [Niallia taxi]RVT57199.1 hypothetical protein EM808_24980 [Niallia taxi]
MNEKRIEHFNEIVNLRKESTEALLNYWEYFTFYTSFEYWLLVGFFLIPLIILIKKIDKSNIFLIGFFGYCIHIATLYSNLLAVNLGLWNYPIQLIPTMPSFSLDSSLIPVTYMLAYQWTMIKNKNYYITIFVVSAFFSFIFEPLIVKLGMLKMYGEITHVHTFFVYIFIGLFAKFTTNIFLWLQKKYAS